MTSNNSTVDSVIQGLLKRKALLNDHRLGLIKNEMSYLKKIAKIDINISEVESELKEIDNALNILNMGRT